MNNQNHSPRPTVFFDGGCLLCSREIRHYRRLDRFGRLRWVDITREPDELGSVGLDPNSAMARFHVLESDGSWQSGAWGFVAMWSRLPGYRWLACLIRATHTTAFLDLPYRWFAKRRLRSRCGGSCSVTDMGGS